MVAVVEHAALNLLACRVAGLRASLAGRKETRMRRVITVVIVSGQRIAEFSLGLALESKPG